MRGHVALAAALLLSLGCIATVRQKFTRRLIVDGETRTVHTEVTQRETWRKTADGWKLTFVDEVRDHVRR